MASAIQFKPAKLEALSLLIGLVAGTGGGKTFTAMRLATGLAGGQRFAVIDTEAGRAKHYAAEFAFDHADMTPPFTPHAYQAAILAADASHYPVIVVDSFSHEWAGDGGVLDMQEAELDRMAGQDWKKRESCKMAAWIKPKSAHKKMVQRLLQIRAHLILCFRAEEKVEMVRNDKGKMEIVPKRSLTGLNGWVPICEKNLPFELTLSFLLMADRPGVPRPIKLEAQHRKFVPLDKPVDERVGEELAKWAAGGTAPAKAKAAAQTTTDTSTRPPPAARPGSSTPPEQRELGAAQAFTIETAIAALMAARTTAGLKRAWDAINADFQGRDEALPLEVEAKYEEMHEALTERGR